MLVSLRARVCASSLALALAACVAPPPPAVDWGRRPDFAALRAEYGAKDDFGELCEQHRPMREADQLFERERWSALVALTDRWLARCPVDMDAHMVRTIGLERLSRREEAQDHREWARGLLEAVLATGDGQSAETAYAVISVFEEYAVLRMLGYQPKSQALLEGRIDALTAERAGETTTIYFDPAASFARMMKQLGGPEEGKP